MKTNLEILELHFGSEFYRLKELGYLDNILNAMNEYAIQEIRDFSKSVTDKMNLKND